LDRFRLRKACPYFLVDKLTNIGAIFSCELVKLGLLETGLQRVSFLTLTPDSDLFISA